MYLRLVHANVKPGLLDNLRKVYDNVVIPGLIDIPGCLYAFLIKGEVKEDEVISMTLWDSLESAKTYEKSGSFIKLYSATEPFLTDSSEWKIQLSEDMKLEYKPVSSEPNVTTYKSLAEHDSTISIKNYLHQMYLRVMHLKVKKGKMEELKELYIEKIIPALQSVNGCQYAHLSEGKENKAISLTIWKSKKHMEEYEKSGLYDRLTEKAEHLFSELYQWKMNLEKEPGKKIITSDDLDIETYTLVTGKKLK